jgi:hypothetical protein
MMNNNHKNTGCGFTEELISYLYGESSASEKATFETHLQNCSICTDELQAFSGVHFSINDWKEKDFDALETPVIEIPGNRDSLPDRAAQTGSSGRHRFVVVSASRLILALSPRMVAGSRDNGGFGNHHRYRAVRV